MIDIPARSCTHKCVQQQPFPIRIVDKEMIDIDEIIRNTTPRHSLHCIEVCEPSQVTQNVKAGSALFKPQKDLRSSSYL